MTAEHDRETLDWRDHETLDAIRDGGMLTRREIAERVREILAARDEALAKVAEIETFAGIMAAYHRPDETRGGCICGFCAWSVEHVAIMSVRDAMDALAAGSSGALVVTAPRPAEEPDLERSLRDYAKREGIHLSLGEAIYLAAWAEDVIADRLAAVERERDEARAENQRLHEINDDLRGPLGRETMAAVLTRAEAAEARLAAARHALVATGYFTADQVGDDIAPRITEILTADAPVPPQPEPDECPTPCDADCETDCHEVHDVKAHRQHDPAECPSVAQPEPERCEHGQTGEHVISYVPVFDDAGHQVGQTPISCVPRRPGPVSPQSTEETSR